MRVCPFRSISERFGTSPMFKRRKKMKVLVLNCGSSSLKYQLINMENEEVMAKGYLEKIGLPD